MSDNWEITSLEKIAFIEMGQSPSGDTCNQDGVGLPLLNGPTEFGGYHPTPIQFTTDPKKYSALNDILFCVRGSTTGRMNWADQKYAIGRGIAAIRHRKGLEYRYFLKAIIDFHLPILLASATGSTFPNVSREQLANLQCEIPSLPVQRAIAGILGALDDKIEVNHRMNVTLESMARAVFRQWFVEGEQLNKWDELTWGEIATLEYGKSLSGYKDSSAPYVVYGTNGPIGKHTEPLYSSEGIIIGRKGAYRGIHYSPDPFFVIDTAFYLKPQKPFSMKWAYYELLRFDLNNMDSGSAIPSTSRTDFYNIPVLFPPQELMDSFEAFAAPLFSKIHVNEKESRTLASLRDSLLPRLMRGEVRVKDVEEIL